MVLSQPSLGQLASSITSREAYSAHNIGFAPAGKALQPSMSLGNPGDLAQQGTLPAQKATSTSILDQMHQVWSTASPDVRAICCSCALHIWLTDLGCSLPPMPVSSAAPTPARAAPTGRGGHAPQVREPHGRLAPAPLCPPLWRAARVQSVRPRSCRRARAAGGAAARGRAHLHRRRGGAAGAAGSKVGRRSGGCVAGQGALLPVRRRG